MSIPPNDQRNQRNQDYRQSYVNQCWIAAFSREQFRLIPGRFFTTVILDADRLGGVL